MPAAQLPYVYLLQHTVVNTYENYVNYVVKQSVQSLWVSLCPGVVE